jgi:predicted O-methyltransferase YrrM
MVVGASTQHVAPLHLKRHSEMACRGRLSTTTEESSVPAGSLQRRNGTAAVGTRALGRLFRGVARFGEPWASQWRDQRSMRALQKEEPIGRRLHAVISAVRERRETTDPLLEATEKWRARTATRFEPLVDGSLGEPGLYDENVTISDAVKVSRKPLDAYMLYVLVREFRPQTVVELGTNVGISSAYLAAGQSRNGFGRTVTFDASPYRQRLARELHGEIGVHNVDCVCGLFTDTLVPQLNRGARVELAYIDGHHQYQPTLDYFDQICRHAADLCVFIFDDINWSDGMRNAWSSLKSDPRFTIIVDLRRMGIGVVANGQPSLQFVTDQIKTVL